MKPPLVSVIICTRGRPDDLALTLQSLRGVAVPPEVRAELVVVENSADRQAETVVAGFRHPDLTVRYLSEPTAGKPHALNRAVRETQSDVLLFTDDDVRFPPDWIAGVCGPILRGEADGVAGGVRLAPHLLRPWMGRLHRAWLASTADYLTAPNPSEMCGANMAVSRRAIEAAGPYNIELGPGRGNMEETVLSWQIRQRGFKIAAALDVQVEHHFSPGRLRYEHWVKVATENGRSKAYLLHHWHHRRAALPALRQIYFRFKLALRRALTGRRRAGDEGIPPWELSYQLDASCWKHYRTERRRPRRYAPPSLTPSS
ncbi:MAG TPA: glycosyltransferase [Opitutaceae bacterium]|jgi:glycosyltransferase involved in cell wall biosynthesis